eukprot:SAG11_NODE_116_length_16002_cov_19.164560_18_plen_90_part_00
MPWYYILISKPTCRRLYKRQKVKIVKEGTISYRILLYFSKKINKLTKRPLTKWGTMLCNHMDDCRGPPNAWRINPSTGLSVLSELIATS